MTSKNSFLFAFLRGLALVLAFSLGLPVFQTWAGPPTESVKTVIDEVMLILHDPAYQSPGQKPNRLRRIEETALKSVAYQEMAKRSLEDTWQGLGPAQRAEFVRLFTALLKASYADKLDDFAKYKVAFQGETIRGGQAEVRSLITRPNDKIPVNFQLLKTAKGWMIYDMVIDKVSLVNNFRQEFGRVVRATSFASLMKCLKLKLQSNLAELKACPAPPAPAPRKGRREGS